jgi:hypothetical protein
MSSTANHTWICDVLPFASRRNVKDQCATYTEFLRQGVRTIWPLTISFVALLNFGYLSFCKFIRPMRRSMNVTPFLHHIPCIILRSSEKQMCWVTARRIITSMANQHVIRHFSVLHEVCNAVCKVIFTFMHYAAIAVFGETAPRPTHIQARHNFNTVPEPGGKKPIKTFFRHWNDDAYWYALVKACGMSWGKY